MSLGSPFRRTGTPAIDANIAECATVTVVAGCRARFIIRIANAVPVAKVGVVAQRVRGVSARDRWVQQGCKRIDGTCDFDAVTDFVCITHVNGWATDDSSGRNAVNGACL